MVCPVWPRPGSAVLRTESKGLSAGRVCKASRKNTLFFCPFPLRSTEYMQLASCCRGSTPRMRGRSCRLGKAKIAHASTLSRTVSASAQKTSPLRPRFRWTRARVWMPVSCRPLPNSTGGRNSRRLEGGNPGLPGNLGREWRDVAGSPGLSSSATPFVGLGRSGEKGTLA